MKFSLSLEKSGIILENQRLTNLTFYTSSERLVKVALLSKEGVLDERISFEEKPFEEELITLSQFSSGLLLVVPKSLI